MSSREPLSEWVYNRFPWCNGTCNILFANAFGTSMGARQIPGMTRAGGIHA
jgi:hypothetical protein